MRTHWLKASLVFGMFSTFFVLYYRDFIFLEKVFSFGGDNTYLLAPVFSEISRILASGIWPLKLNNFAMGLEIYNTAQFSIFYPFYPFHFYELTTPLMAAKWLNHFTILHIFIGGINLIILCKALRLTWLSALFAGIVYVTAGNTLVYGTWINISSPYAWVPLYITGLIYLVRGQSLKGFALSAIALILIILASPAQPLIHCLFITGLFFFYVMYSIISNGITWKKTWSSGKYFYIPALFMLIAVFLVTTPVLLPTLIDMQHMIRWIGPFPPVVGGQRIPFNAFLIDQAPPSEVIRLFWLGASKSLVGSSFIGLIPTALVILGFFKINKRSLLWVFAFLWVYGLISSFGQYSGMAYLNYIIPFVNKIREPSRHLVLLVISSGVLAGVGLDYLFTKTRKVKKPILIGIVALVLIGHQMQMSQILDKYPALQDTDMASETNTLSHIILSRIKENYQGGVIKIDVSKMNSQFFGMNCRISSTLCHPIS